MKKKISIGIIVIAIIIAVYFLFAPSPVDNQRSRKSSEVKQTLELTKPRTETNTEQKQAEEQKARLLRQGFLQQNALDEVDAYSTIQKQIQILSVILHFHQRAQRIIKAGAPIAAIHDLPVVTTVIRMKSLVTNDELSKLDDIQHEVDEQMDQLEAKYQ